MNLLVLRDLTHLGGNAHDLLIGSKGVLHILDSTRQNPALADFTYYDLVNLRTYGSGPMGISSEMGLPTTSRGRWSASVHKRVASTWTWIGGFEIGIRKTQLTSAFDGHLEDAYLIESYTSLNFVQDYISRECYPLLGLTVVDSVSLLHLQTRIERYDSIESSVITELESVRIIDFPDSFFNDFMLFGQILLLTII